MYESFIQPPAIDVEHHEVTHHSGSVRDFLDRHRHSVATAVKGGPPGFSELAPHLMRRLADARMLRAAWDDLSRGGDSAPGPDGMVASDLDDQETWALLRALGHSIRSGEYRPGPARRLAISKGPGRGERVLSVQSLVDRVVARAAALLIEGLYEPAFDERSYGFRPARGRLDALARAMTITSEQGRYVWVVNDIRDAFDRVPRARLLDVLGRTLPEEIVEFLGVITDTSTRRGLRQGSPLSPLLLNIYLDHFLDRPWRRGGPDIPLLRTADDLLVLCRDGAEAEGADAELRRLLVPAGLPLKFEAEQATHDLAAGNGARWLGFTIVQGADQQLEVGLDEALWHRLADHLTEAHRRPAPPLTAEQIVRGWIGQLGPCCDTMDVRAACERVIELGEAQAFDELPDVDELLGVWGEAADRWRRTLRAAASTEGAR